LTGRRSFAGESVTQAAQSARLGHALITKACIDRGVLSLPWDKDFRAFPEAAELHLIL